MKRKTVFLIVLVNCTLLLTACFRPNYNVEGFNKTPSFTHDIQQDDKTLVFVSLSGGGTRAAAMSWKVLEELKKIPYPYIDKNGQRVESTLADEIDYISGISGGSFTAAAWCLYKDNMELFRRRFIERNIELAIEQMVDICKHLVSGLDLKEPETYSECFESLAASNIIHAESVATFQTMVRFRNMLIHIYDGVDDSITYGIYAKRTGDFRLFISQLREFIHKAQKHTEQ